jgi:L-ascorbate metabolism protein UlaG (beta-lactamase superfamily)
VSLPFNPESPFALTRAMLYPPYHQGPTAAFAKPVGFTSSVSLTHISTATAVLSIDGINFLTDPAFDPNGTSYDLGDMVLRRILPTALQLQDLPPIDAVLLSHEDHEDNLDPTGRTLLNGRRVLTTQDGARKLAPRPGVRGLAPWESTQLTLSGKTFNITAMPCDHFPGGEVIGFTIHTESFGKSADGRPNVIYLSGDTVYMDSVAQWLRKDTSVALAVPNLGAATVPGPAVITMNGSQAIHWAQAIDAHAVVPLHYESWEHFAEQEDALRKVLESDANPIKNKFLMLQRGKATPIL